jgi:hypothetical protein
MKVPKRAAVDRALKTAARQVESCLKAVNRDAAAFVRRGRYSEGEGLLVVGREIATFAEKIEEVRNSWRTLAGSPKGSKEDRPAITPLWQYYEPILQALEGAGGEATRADLEARLPALLEGRLKPGDTLPIGRIKTRWMAMLRRARRPMIKEGFLDPSPPKGRWRITAEGRRAAHREAGSKPE